MVNMAAVFGFLILSSVMFNKCLCYPAGAPDAQCERMTPSHGVNAQTGASPYEIQVDKPYYMPGSNVNLYIRSSNEKIKGFLIQARQVGANSATGMFETLPTNGKYVACGNSKGAVTHTTRLAVKRIDFEWTPPSNLAGNISFFATVVKDTTTFWVKLQSPQLYKKETNVTQPSISVQPSPSTTSMTSMTTVVPSTPAVNNTCKADDPKCDGAQLNQNVILLFFVGLLLAFMQNAI